MELLCGNSFFGGEISDELYKKNVNFSARETEY